ncbi:MAG: cupin domain-containing protein [Candidatus Moranbacteria bacterium]|nr:cupin domain-containing protein [Candidatus Moranbacteria bacterium]
MIHSSIDKDSAKGWFAGPWNSELPVPVGYANEGIREKHLHSEMYEIYLIAKGTSTIVIDGKEIDLKEGDMMVVEPGEAHIFTDSSDDYLHFVIHSPFVENDKRIVG